jgi:hypothetical protein
MLSAVWEVGPGGDVGLHHSHLHDLVVLSDTLFALKCERCLELSQLIQSGVLQR